VNYTVNIEGRQFGVAIADSYDAVSQLRADWTRMTESGHYSAFATWEWLYSWAETFVVGRRKLFVLVVSEKSRVIGIAPWYIDITSHGIVQVRQIRFLGGPEAGSDYLDVIAARGKERSVAQTLCAALFDGLSSSWDTLNLNEIPAESAFLMHFANQLRGIGKHYEIKEGSFCPIAVLPDSFEGYLQQISSHSRRAYRRKIRVLDSTGDCEHVIAKTEQEVAALLPVFQTLYERRWARKMDKLFELVSSYLARSGTAWPVQLSLMSADDRAVAGLVHLTNGHRMCQYLMAVDRTFNHKATLGKLISGMNIEAAIEGGYTEYDFLKGHEQFKLELMTHARRSINLCVHNRNLRSLSAWTWNSASQLGKLILR
jgi:CelD/BcsL family acetyltransferase involved in cellulose biosynthesis